jgi:hypothetical protein
MAARLTERWRSRLTMRRHSKMARRKAPRMAPTAMKTVPSGARECCIKGAFSVGGIAAAG